MGKETISPTAVEQVFHAPGYEKAASRSSLATTIQQITTSGVQQVALVTIILHFEQDHKPPRSPQTDHCASYILQHLRPLVRKTDTVVLLDSMLHFLLRGANEVGGQIVKDRLWDALLWRFHQISSRDIVRPHSITIGYSAYPTPCSSIDALLEAAMNAHVRFDATPEKPARKPPARQPHPPLNAIEGELPALARKLGIPYLSLLPRKPVESIQQLVNPRLAQELHCYPLGREHNTLTVAVSNPQDRSALDRLQQETGLLIFPVLTNPHELQTALEQLI